MSDIYCARCGEPWEADYVRHEMHALDRQRFLKGEGCEVCDFGRSCTHCSGTGRAKFDRHAPSQSLYCEACLGSRFLTIRQLARTGQPEKWAYGYRPNVRVILNPEIIFRYRGENTQEGLARSAKAHCPACREQAPSCSSCSGTGKLNPVPDGEIRAAISEIEASDEEPVGILARRLQV